jgi:hypothetical protein
MMEGVGKPKAGGGGAMSKIEAEAGGGKPRRGRPPSPRGRLPLVLSMKGNPAWKEWLLQYAEAKGVTPTDLIDLALAQMAKRDRQPTPPSRVD